MPILVWQEILQTNNLKHLFKSGKGRVTSKIHDLWTDLQQQYFDEFGIDVEFEMRMNKMKRLALLNLEWITTKNRRILNDIAMLEIELANWGKDQGVKFHDLVDRVQSVKKFQIDLEKMTVVAWYYMIKNISKTAPNVSN